jgi:hypothetical protein
MLLEVDDLPEGVTEWRFVTERRGDQIAVSSVEPVILAGDPK